MKSLYNYIISTDERYNNKKSIDDKELILNTEITERDYHFVNRIGKVISVPINIPTPVKPGDKVIVHHNVFRRWFDVRGKERDSGSYITDNIYGVYPDQVYAYKSTCCWKALPGYCFVKPVPVRKSIIMKPVEEEPLVGIIKYTNAKLTEFGVKENDEVVFEPECEYPFYINGEKLYRMFWNNITMVL